MEEARSRWERRQEEEVQEEEVQEEEVQEEEIEDLYEQFSRAEVIRGGRAQIASHSGSAAKARPLQGPSWASWANRAPTEHNTPMNGIRWDESSMMRVVHPLRSAPLGEIHLRDPVATGQPLQTLFQKDEAAGGSGVPKQQQHQRQQEQETFCVAVDCTGWASVPGSSQMEGIASRQWMGAAAGGAGGGGGAAAGGAGEGRGGRAGGGGGTGGGGARGAAVGEAAREGGAATGGEGAGGGTTHPEGPGGTAEPPWMRRYAAKAARRAPFLAWRGAAAADASCRRVQGRRRRGALVLAFGTWLKALLAARASVRAAEALHEGLGRRRLRLVLRAWRAKVLRRQTKAKRRESLARSRALKVSGAAFEAWLGASRARNVDLRISYLAWPDLRRRRVLKEWGAAAARCRSALRRGEAIASGKRAAFLSCVFEDWRRLVGAEAAIVAMAERSRKMRMQHDAIWWWAGWAESRQKRNLRLEFASRWRETHLKMAAVAGFQRNVLRRISEDVNEHLAWEHLSRQRASAALRAWRDAAARSITTARSIAAAADERRRHESLYSSALLSRAFASMVLHVRLPLRVAFAQRLRRERRRQVCVLLSWRLVACRSQAHAAAAVAAAIASLLSEAASVTSESSSAQLDHDPEERTLSRYWLQGPYCHADRSPADASDDVTFWQGHRTCRAEDRGDF